MATDMVPPPPAHPALYGCFAFKEDGAGKLLG